MRIPGRRIKRTRLVHSDRYVVAVDVELVIPDEDPSEPCYESETIQLLKQVAEHADSGDLDWLRRHGRVDEAIDAV
ncbi:MAG TPA: hypothetical protein VML55_16520 [Planctomycetaceae bacterium]|nr:hypothetical protein [Planctomycetaceae bacterium]